MKEDVTVLDDEEKVVIGPKVTDDLSNGSPEDQQATFAYLSDIFKYISHYRRGGHQIGRKVGDMLEVLTLAALFRNPNARKQLTLEPRLIGFSGAGHKVEFALFRPGSDGLPSTEMSELTAFIECKKVGVEQTIDQAFKRVYGKAAKVPYGAPLRINFSPKWADKAAFLVTFEKTSEGATCLVELNGDHRHEAAIGNAERLIFGLTVEGEPFFLGNDESLRDIDSSIRACRILEVSSIAEEGVFCLLNSCLTGPQTPEKAKQASFVALDVRKGRFGQFDKRENESECVSVLVMTEFSHWEPKSVNMVTASIDHNLVVDDSLIIRALDVFESELGPEFLDSITKETFLRDKRVKALAYELVGDGRIFRDISDGRYKSLKVSEDHKIIIE